ncbi:hypothetical protein A4X03_0g8962 [Tilletia caries]|uniref:Uncharacterized protein n=1 Tax=Tilletia caries TaxID=13290 RepID=A0A8T8SEM0_9BASI|nr:hypothetical protein A4X03_0g8962 [Tilletia caries]
MSQRIALVTALEQELMGLYTQRFQLPALAEALGEKLPQTHQVTQRALARGQRQQHQHQTVTAPVDRLELHVETALAALQEALNLFAVFLGQFECEQAGRQIVVPRVAERALEQLRVVLGIGIRQLQGLGIAHQQIGDMPGENRQQAEAAFVEHEERHLLNRQNRQDAVFGIDQRHADLQRGMTAALATRQYLGTHTDQLTALQALPQEHIVAVQLAHLAKRGKRLQLDLLVVQHPVEPCNPQRAVLRKQRDDRVGQGPEGITITRQGPQLFAQAEQGAAQTLVVARHALLQAIMGNTQDVMRAGELVEAQLAVLVGQAEALETTLPDVAELAYQHAAQQHPHDEGGRSIQIDFAPGQAKYEQRCDEQRRTEQPLQESIANAEQYRYENHPGKRRRHEQRIVRR